MSDFTLNYGDDVLISSPATIENFVYRGGKLRLVPNIYYYKTGDFLFASDSVDNPEDKIFNCIISRFSIESGTNGKFPGFKLYDIYPSSALFFPCIVFQYSPTESSTTSLFGNDIMLNMDILIELAFKRDFRIQTETGLIGEKDLVEHMIFNTNQIINDIKFQSDKIKVGEIKINPQTHFPKEANQTLYGYSIDMTIEYMIGN